MPYPSHDERARMLPTERQRANEDAIEFLLKSAEHTKIVLALIRETQERMTDLLLAMKPGTLPSVPPDPSLFDSHIEPTIKP